MSSSPIIRPATQIDLVAIDALLDDVDELHRAELPWLLRKSDSPRPAEFLNAFIGDPDHVALIAAHAEVVGVVTEHEFTA